jgi:hypothetical protein
MEKFREWLMPFWFFGFALGGVAFTSLLTGLGENAQPFGRVVTAGAFAGIVVGGTAALILYYFHQKKYRN